MLMNLVPLGSKSSLDQISLNLEMVSLPTCSPSSSFDVSKLSSIIAMKRFKKMKETMTIKLTKNIMALSGSPQPSIFNG